MSRFLRKKHRFFWIRGLTDIPVTKKPKDMRMGKGKGLVSYWVLRAAAGKVLFEISNVKSVIAKFILKQASKKLPVPTCIIRKNNQKWRFK